MRRWLIALCLVLAGTPRAGIINSAAAGGSVAFDTGFSQSAAATCGGDDCDSADNGTSPLAGVTDITIGASSTCLVVVAALECVGSDPVVGATWAAAALTCTTSATATGRFAAVCFKTNPTTGNQTLQLSWTGGATCDVYYDAASFTGTNMTTCATDVTTGTTADTITVTGSATGATVAVVADDDGDPTITCNGGACTGTLFVESPFNPGGGAAYLIGTADGTDDFTFSDVTATVWATAGLHVVPP